MSDAAHAVVVAARRTAIGRPGGLHRSRRLESLTAPVIEAVLQAAALEPETVDEIFLGNTTAGGNPARIVALVAGLREHIPALTVDCQCASGLEAILLAAHVIARGEADVVIAGGAEAVSTAPWRVAKPKGLFQTPRFIGLEGEAVLNGEASESIAASEALAARLEITRSQQDAYTLRSCLKADKAYAERRFAGEIVPLRMSAEEARDEIANVPEIEDLDALPPLLADATHTIANSSVLAEGAAIVAVVSARMHSKLGSPPGLRLRASARVGTAAGDEARAPILALQDLLTRADGIKAAHLGAVEMSEIAAAQAIATGSTFGFADEILNPAGGALARGHPLGAAGALAVVRLFSDLVRTSNPDQPRYGAVTQGAVGGLAVAALFEVV